MFVWEALASVKRVPDRVRSQSHTGAGCSSGETYYWKAEKLRKLTWKPNTRDTNVYRLNTFVSQTVLNRLFWLFFDFPIQFLLNCIHRLFYDSFLLPSRKPWEVPSRAVHIPAFRNDPGRIDLRDNPITYIAQRVDQISPIIVKSRDVWLVSTGPDRLFNSWSFSWRASSSCMRPLEYTRLKNLWNVCLFAHPISKAVTTLTYTYWTVFICKDCASCREAEMSVYFV